METQILTTVLVTILSVGVLSTIMYLAFAVRSLKRESERSKNNLVNFHQDYDVYQSEIERTFDGLYKDLDIRFDRAYRKLDKKTDEIYKELEYISNQKLQEEVKKCVKHIVLPTDV